MAYRPDADGSIRRMDHKPHSSRLQKVYRLAIEVVAYGSHIEQQLHQNLWCTALKCDSSHPLVQQKQGWYSLIPWYSAAATRKHAASVSICDRPGDRS